MDTFVLLPLIFKTIKMPLVPNFSTSQTVGVPESINFTDTSTGSDVAITERRVYILTSSGSFLVQEGTTTEYEVWAYADSTTSLDVLTKDYAAIITVQWLNTLGVVLYSKQITGGYTLYNETFDYQLTQVLSGNPLLINDNQFFKNKSELRECIDSGNQSISLASDIYAAQQCYDRGTNLRLNSPYFFNSNT